MFQDFQSVSDQFELLNCYTLKSKQISIILGKVVKAILVISANFWPLRFLTEEPSQSLTEDLFQAFAGSFWNSIECK